MTEFLANCASNGLYFKVFGLGFIAGGLFSFAVSMVTDWLHDKEQRKLLKIKA